MHDSDSIVSKAYVDMYSSMSHSNHNWVTYLELIKFFFNMINYWENQGYAQPHKTAKLLRNTMKRLYENDWSVAVGHSSCNNAGNKLRTYQSFKTKFGLENYILFGKSIHMRQNFTKLRISAHSLKIETGRYLRPKIPPEERICVCCKAGECEDEFHFIMKCSLYDEERAALFEKLNHFLDLSSLNLNQVFSMLMSTNGGDTEIIPIILAFTNACFSKRETVVIN